MVPWYHGSLLCFITSSLLVCVLHALFLSLLCARRSRPPRRVRSCLTMSSRRQRIERIERVGAAPAVKTVLLETEDLLLKNQQTIDALNSKMDGSVASRNKLLEITTNLAKIKAMYDDILSSDPGSGGDEP
jgi:hypothetical protein